MLAQQASLKAVGMNLRQNVGDTVKKQQKLSLQYNADFIQYIQAEISAVRF